MTSRHVLIVFALLFLVIAVGNYRARQLHEQIEGMTSQPWIVWPGIKAAEYPKSYAFIEQSGCIVPGEAWSTPKIRCVLEKADVVHQPSYGEEAHIALNLLEAKLH